MSLTAFIPSYRSHALSVATILAVLSSAALATIAFARPTEWVAAARVTGNDPNAYATSDQSGKDCTPKHVIFVSLLIGGQHWGKGRKYIDLQVVGKEYSSERPFYAKTKSRRFVVCSVQRVIFDRYRSGRYVNPMYNTYFPSSPGLSVRGTIPPSSNKEVELIAFGRFKAKH